MSFEISFCGHSGSGKTTLITKLINRFSKSHQVAYHKHDAHSFDMDKEGKDTWKAKEAGASQVLITSEDQNAFITRNSSFQDKLLLDQQLLDSDIIIVEGYKNSLKDKILLWKGSEEDEKLLESYLSDPKQNLLAIVGKFESSPLPHIPYFHRDDVEGIYRFLMNYWKIKIRQTPLKALILAGGQSKRMGQDKGKIQYFGKSQTEHLYGLLKEEVDEVYVSCREEQSGEDHLKNLPKITDVFPNKGPMGGILSCFEKDPQAAWLVIACDMPYVSRESIRTLVDGRNPFKMATSFYNEEKQWAEPLFTIYEPKAAKKLGTYMAWNKLCPRKVLFNSNIETILPENEQILKNANHPEELLTIKKHLMKESGALNEYRN